MAKQTKSLVEVSGALTDYVPNDYAPVYQVTPYVNFMSNKGASFAKAVAHIPDLCDGEPVLIRGEPDVPIVLRPFKFYLLHDAYHFSHVEETGEISESTFDTEKARAAGKYFSEHIETVILVCLPTAIVPARCTFKTLKVKASQAAKRGLVDAGGPNWGKLSADHQATLVSPDPRFRFTTTVHLATQTFRGTGRKGVLATGVCKPTSVADWKQVADAFNDPKFCDLLKATVSRFNERMAEIRGLVAG
jgi:hypothetical protein